MHLMSPRLGRGVDRRVAHARGPRFFQEETCVLTAIGVIYVSDRMPQDAVLRTETDPLVPNVAVDLVGFRVQCPVDRAVLIIPQMANPIRLDHLSAGRRPQEVRHPRRSVFARDTQMDLHHITLHWRQRLVVEVAPPVRHDVVAWQRESIKSEVRIRQPKLGFRRVVFPAGNVWIESGVTESIAIKHLWVVRAKILWVVTAAGKERLCIRFCLQFVGGKRMLQPQKMPRFMSQITVVATGLEGIRRRIKIAHSHEAIAGR